MATTIAITTTITPSVTLTMMMATSPSSPQKQDDETSWNSQQQGSRCTHVSSPGMLFYF